MPDLDLGPLDSETHYSNVVSITDEQLTLR